MIAIPTTSSTPAFDMVRRATGHYENFTVVSFRQPRRIKDGLASIYAYCRYADDLADESGDPGAALAALDQWEERFSAAVGGDPDHPILEALASTIQSFDLPHQPFRDLLVAFRQDQTVHRYQMFEDLLRYCRYSANPVGRIVLALFGYRDEQYYPASDAICTGLQLANFWQDVDRDVQIGRIYLPMEDLAEYGVSEGDVVDRRFTEEFRRLMIFEVERAGRFFVDGKALAGMVGRDIRWEIEMFRRAGLSVLGGVERVGYNVFRRRPTVSFLRKVWIAVSSFPVMMRK